MNATQRPNVFGATLTRRQFVKTGGALSWASAWWDANCSKGTASGRDRKNSLDASLSTFMVRNSRRQHHPDAHGQGATSGSPPRTPPTGRSSPRS